MAASVIPLQVEQGTTWRFQMNWKNPDESPIVLTGCSARSQWRAAIDSEDILLTLTTENGRIAITPLTGEIVLKLTAEDTAALTFTSAVYDLEIVFPAEGTEIPVYRIAKGKVKISKEITRG